MTARPMPGRRAFTLMEVLVTLGLAIALLAAVLTFYFNTLNTRQRLLSRSAQHRAASVLIERLEAELLVSVASGPAGRAGIVGNARSLTVTSRSVATAVADRGPLEPALYTDAQVSRYEFTPASGQLALARWSAADESSREDELIGTDIADVRFRYYDGSRWRDSFDSSQADALPIAVEIAVWFERIDAADAADTSLTADDSASADAPDVPDAPGNFDEFEFAMRDDRGFDEEPLPDRLRIIRVPDAAEEDTLADSDNAAGAEP